MQRDAQYLIRPIWSFSLEADITTLDPLGLKRSTLRCWLISVWHADVHDLGPRRHSNLQSPGYTTNGMARDLLDKQQDTQ